MKKNLAHMSFLLAIIFFVGFIASATLVNYFSNYSEMIKQIGQVCLVAWLITFSTSIILTIRYLLNNSDQQKLIPVKVRSKK